MRAPAVSPVPSRALAAADAVAIVVFVTIGLLSHHGGLSARGYARDAIPFLGFWFAAAAAFRLYPRPERWRLAATWAAGVPAAVLVRALVLGHDLDGKEAAFLAVSLVTIGILVPVTRLCARVLLPAPSSRRSARTPSPPVGS
jgi:hypothetical protein